MAGTVSPLPQIKLFMSAIFPRGGVVGGGGACPSLASFTLLLCHSDKLK